jgi:4-hydroxy-4-methyl-2-oxoglutarate aldolase
MNTEKHVIKDINRVSPDLIEAIKSFPSATIYEAYGAKGALNHFIKPIRSSMGICGPAVTVKARPGDNLIVHKSIYTAQPGDILVVDTSSYVEAGFWGDIMTAAAQHQGVAGLVTDGAVRDSEDIASLGFPIFCQALCIKATTKSCLGTINMPIFMAGAVINPGDLIVGDADGVTVVAREDVPWVIEKARQREEKETRVSQLLKEGKTTLELYGLSEILERIGLKEE